ncbi:MAG: hypothetical protein AAF211_29135, partial [Myxococcota bacterium]
LVGEKKGATDPQRIGYVKLTESWGGCVQMLAHVVCARRGDGVVAETDELPRVMSWLISEVDEHNKKNPGKRVRRMAVPLLGAGPSGGLSVQDVARRLLRRTVQRLRYASRKDRTLHTVLFLCETTEELEAMHWAASELGHNDELLYDAMLREQTRERLRG